MPRYIAILKILLILQIGVQAISCTKEPTSPIWNGTADTSWYNESQTKFIITTAEQLAGLAELVSKGNDFKKKTLVLGKDIMLNDTTGWQNWEKIPPKNKWKPIGIYIEDKDKPEFFGHLGMTFLSLIPDFIQRALGLKPTTLSFSGTFDGNGYVVSGVYINSEKAYQGLFGTVKGELRNLGVVASYIKGGEYTGGLVGANADAISNSYSAAWVTGTYSTGGLAGMTGDFIGRGSMIINSYSTGKVTGKGNLGGLVGFGGTIINSYSSAEVTGTGHVGGLVGLTSEEKIINSYSIGAVTGGNSGGRAGGLVGFNKSGNTIVSSYYDMQTSGHAKSEAGDGKTTQQMKLQATFKDWDFENVWSIDSTINNGYPYLRWVNP